jgi:hypothetical protein
MGEEEGKKKEAILRSVRPASSPDP